MNTHYPNQIIHISQIIERTRHHEESFLIDSSKAATDIMQYLQDEKIITKFNVQLLYMNILKLLFPDHYPKKKETKVNLPTQKGIQIKPKPDDKNKTFSIFLKFFSRIKVGY